MCRLLETHSEFPDIAGSEAWRARRSPEARGSVADRAQSMRATLGCAGILPGLLSDRRFAVFDGEHVQPIGTDSTVENAIGLDPVGPDLILLKVAVHRFAVEGMLGKVDGELFPLVLT